jgi:hypothetical protein
VFSRHKEAISRRASFAAGVPHIVECDLRTVETKRAALGDRVRRRGSEAGRSAGRRQSGRRQKQLPNQKPIHKANLK